MDVSLVDMVNPLGSLNTAQQIGAAIAEEMQFKNAHVSLARTCNIHRLVANWRIFECYSEDPELSAALAVGYFNGRPSKSTHEHCWTDGRSTWAKP